MADSEAVRVKREQEKAGVHFMIEFYCHHKHKTAKGNLCPECQELADFSAMRIDKCPFMETKTFCSECKVQCFRSKPEMQKRIGEVMRYSGPRMIVYSPKTVLKHGWLTMKRVIKNKMKAKRRRRSEAEISL